MRFAGERERLRHPDAGLQVLRIVRRCFDAV